MTAAQAVVLSNTSGVNTGNQDLSPYATLTYVNQINPSTGLAFLTNASLGNLTSKVNYIDACLGQASKLAIAMNTSIGLYAPLADPQFTSAAVGTPSAPTPTAGTNSTRIATTQFVMYVDASLDILRSRHNFTETSVGVLTSRHNFTETSVGTLTSRHNFTETSVGYHDVSIKLLDSLKSPKDSPTFTTKVDITGNLYVTGEVEAHYASDSRLKINTNTFYASDIINKIKPVTFNWNEKAKELNIAKDDRLKYGIIAQELEEIIPELVYNIYDDYKSIDYVSIIPILIQAIKEQQKQINELKKWQK